MKYIVLGMLAAGLLAGCEKKDEGGIDATKNATKDAINTQKESVDQAAKDAKAQMDADKKKADAAAEAAKAQLPATNK